MRVKRSVILREERRLKVFENSVVRIIFGPKMEEVSGGTGSRNGELQMLCSSPNIINAVRRALIKKHHLIFP
jgi:hypothetical protein